MTVLLISPPSFSPTERFYIPCAEIPLNLCCLAAYLERGGVHTDIFDCDVAGRRVPFRSILERSKPRLVGFTAYTPYVGHAHRLATEVKEWNPSVPVIIGGYHATAFPTQTLEEFPAFDILVFGEGEETLLELSRYYLDGNQDPPAHVDGISFRAPDGGIIRTKRRKQIENLDDLPLPAREKLDLARYVPNPVNYLKKPTTAILAGRGCHFNCRFCSKYLFKGERVRSAENIYLEMKDCSDRFGIRDFRFYDDNFVYHRAVCHKLCEILIREKAGFFWNCFSRVDTIDEELLRLMKAAGCYQIKYGVETGSQRTLAAINKQITFDQSRSAVALAKKVGVECQISMMIGLPDETEDDIRQTIRFAVELSPDLILFNIFKPIPGSVLYNKLKNQNRLRDVPWEDYLVKSPTPVVKDGLAADQLAAFLKQAYFEFYFRPSYYVQRLKWLARAPRRELRRYFTAAGIFLRIFFKR